MCLKYIYQRSLACLFMSVTPFSISTGISSLFFFKKVYLPESNWVAHPPIVASHGLFVFVCINTMH